MDTKFQAKSLRVDKDDDDKHKIDSAEPDESSPPSDPMCDPVTIESDLQTQTASKSSSKARLLLLFVQLIGLPLPRFLLEMLIYQIVVYLIPIGDVEQGSTSMYTSRCMCMCYHYLIFTILETCLTLIIRRIHILEASVIKQKVLDSSKVLELMKTFQTDKETIEEYTKDCDVSEEKELIIDVLVTPSEEVTIDHHPNFENAIALFRGGNQIDLFSTDSDSSISDGDLESLSGDTTESDGETYIPSLPEQNHTHSRIYTGDVQPSGTGEAERRVPTPQTPATLAIEQSPQKDTVSQYYSYPNLLLKVKVYETYTCYTCYFINRICYTLFRCRLMVAKVK